MDEAIAREIPRGVVDLVNTQGDRIRILVAIPDADFAPTLMDLPKTDALLDDAVYTRTQEARAAWQRWAELYTELFAALDSDALGTDNLPTDEAQLLFRGIRIPQPPAGVFAVLEALAPADETVARKQLGIERPVTPPTTGAAFFSGLIGRREEKAKEAGTAVPRPYAQGVPAAPDDLAPDEVTGLPSVAAGLYRQHTDLVEEIRLLEEELDANDRLAADFDVFIRAQRQQVDSITVSFTALAGGVPGDGSGLQLAKWLPFTQLTVLPPSDG